MAKYCNRDKFYDINDFKVGSKVRFRSLPIPSLKKLKLVLDEEFSIKSIIVRVNSIGELSILMELDKLPGKYFSPSVLSLTSMNGVESIDISYKGTDTLQELINKNNDLSSRNSYLESLLTNSLNGNL